MKTGKISLAVSASIFNGERTGVSVLHLHSDSHAAIAVSAGTAAIVASDYGMTKPLIGFP